MGADEYPWTKTLAVSETAQGILLSWNTVPGIRYYRVEYADGLSLGMTWNTFAQVIDSGGAPTASFTDTTVGSRRMRFYRVRTQQ